MTLLLGKPWISSYKYLSCVYKLETYDKIPQVKYFTRPDQDTLHPSYPSAKITVN